MKHNRTFIKRCPLSILYDKWHNTPVKLQLPVGLLWSSFYLMLPIHTLSTFQQILVAPNHYHGCYHTNTRGCRRSKNKSFTASIPMFMWCMVRMMKMKILRWDVLIDERMDKNKWNDGWLGEQNGRWINGRTIKGGKGWAGVFGRVGWWLMVVGREGGPPIKDDWADEGMNV